MGQSTRTFVLIHGGWCGGFIWRGVADRLRARGHGVFAPTLTGLADRSHWLSPKIDLTMHVLDVVNLIKWEELSDIVLVGHSYGGMVISGVAEKVSQGTIRSIVYLDAFYAQSGQSVVDCAAEMAAAFTQDPVPFPFAGQTGHPHFETLVTPQPLRTLTERLELTGARDRIPIKTYVLATGRETRSFADMAQKLKATPGWRHEALPCSHGTMLDMPDETTEVLLRAAG